MNKELFCGVEISWSDFYWSGDYCLPDRIELIINSENEEPLKPCEAQESAWKLFIEEQSTIYETVLTSIFNYYISMRPKYESMGAAFVKSMPTLNSFYELKNMVTLNSVTISWPYDNAPVMLGLSYSCSWEEEHGLGVVLVNNEVIKTGTADCAIL